MDSPLDDPDRLMRLDETGLMDSPASPEFDRLTRLITLALKVPVSLVSLVDNDRQFFKSSCGLPESISTTRETPLSHSFCQHVVSSSEPFIVEDARDHPLVNTNLAIEELQVVAYAGIPITLPDGSVLGAVCAIDSQPRAWSENDIAILTDLGMIATDLIVLQSQYSKEAAAKIELAESRRRLEQILDSTGEGIYGIDEHGVCTFANRKCVELLGFESEDEFLGGKMHNLIHHSHADGSHYPIEKCLIFQAVEKDSGVYSNEEVFWKKCGTPLPVEYRSYPVVDGGSTRAVVTFVDITDQLRRETQLQDALSAAKRANRQKTRFLANMSHEIRTPMNAILGFGELLEGMVESPKARSHVAAIRESGKSLLNLINDILDLSKIEAGKLEVRPEPTHIRVMVESIQGLFSQKAKEKDLHLAIEVDKRCPTYLVIDGQRTRQILLNLISNALKFTREGEVRVTVGTSDISPSDNTVIFTVTVADTGVGIAKHEQKNVFVPFHQVDGSDSIEGTGLGLSICKRLAKLMKGNISLSSVLGKGSTFTLEIPDVEVDATEDAMEAGEEREIEADFDRLASSRILVVDDNAYNLDLVASYLEGSHHQVATALNGMEGVEKVRNWRPDVVLMDIRMPVMDGHEARRRIKENPQTKTIPVVAVTASSLLHDTPKIRSEFDGFIRKPISKVQLFGALANVLDPQRDQTGPANNTGATTAFDPGDFDTTGWDVLVGRLRTWELQRVPPLLDAMVIGEISRFAHELITIGKEACCNELCTYGNALRDQAGNFELSKIEASLGGFGKLVDRIEFLRLSSDPE